MKCDPARKVLEREITDAVRSVDRAVAQIILALADGMPWHAGQVTRPRVALRQALARRTLLNELVMALDEIESLGGAS